MMKDVAEIRSVSPRAEQFLQLGYLHSGETIGP